MYVYVARKNTVGCPPPRSGDPADGVRGPRRAGASLFHRAVVARPTAGRAAWGALAVHLAAAARIQSCRKPNVYARVPLPEVPRSGAVLVGTRARGVWPYSERPTRARRRRAPETGDVLDHRDGAGQVFLRHEGRRASGARGRRRAGPRRAGLRLRPGWPGCRSRRCPCRRCACCLACMPGPNTSTGYASLEYRKLHLLVFGGQAITASRAGRRTARAGICRQCAAGRPDRDLVVVRKVAIAVDGSGGQATARRGRRARWGRRRPCR